MPPAEPYERERVVDDETGGAAEPVFSGLRAEGGADGLYFLIP